MSLILLCQKMIYAENINPQANSFFTNATSWTIPENILPEYCHEY